MNYRLLVSFDVIEFLETLKKADQRTLRDRFLEISDFHANYSDFKEEDANNRPVDIHIAGKYAIKFWEDAADMDLKILDVHLADRG